MDYGEMSLSFISENKLVVFHHIRSGIGLNNSQDIHALSLQGVKGNLTKEIDGWLWNTEISVLAEKEEKLSPMRQEELARLLEKFPEVF